MMMASVDVRKCVSHASSYNIILRKHIHVFDRGLFVLFLSLEPKITQPNMCISLLPPNK